MSELAQHPFSATGRFLGHVKPEPTVDLKLPVSIADAIVELLHREALTLYRSDRERLLEVIASIQTSPSYFKLHVY